MHKILIIGLILLTAASASAQNLSVFNLDASGFPTLKAKFYAFDANGVQQSPSASEITVTEDGIARNVISVTCPPVAPPRLLSSVLVMDVSESMGSNLRGMINMDIAKAAATFWINNVPLGPSECAVASFDDENYFNQDFTTSRKKLQNAVANLQPQNGTNYDAGLLLPVASGLEITKLGKHQKVIIFLTDGLPNFTPQTSVIINEAKRQNCLIFSVTVGLPCPQCLKDISSQTGGKWFENIITQAQIEEVYDEILHQALSGLPPCEIIWQSDTACSSVLQDVQFSWGTKFLHLPYIIPLSSIAQLQFSLPTLYFRSKPIGIRFDTTVTITAINSGFSVTNITSTNPLYDINPRSFTLAAGKSQTLTISYTPPDSSYTWTRFDIATDHCSQTYYASASYPGNKPTVPTLKLTRPNGGEQLLVGSDTVITWTGIPLTDTVKLEYSTDAGSSWNFITDKATGGSYNWHVPKTPSDKCLAKVEQFTGALTNSWARKAGGSGKDIGQAVATDKFGNIYVTGSFQGNLNFGGISLTSAGMADIFVAKYSPDGKVVWVKRAGGTGNDVGNGIAIDDNGNIYVTGYFDSTADFGNFIMTTAGSQDIFIVKYLTDGTVAWVNRAGGVDADDGGTSITVDLSENIYLTGYFRGTVADFGKDTLFVINKPSDIYTEIFIAKYHSDGTEEWAKSAGGVLEDYGSGITTDPNGNIYVTGYINGLANFGSIKTIKNVYEAFVAKYSPDGNTVWVKESGDNQSESFSSGLGIAIDGYGNTYITGGFFGSLNFDGLQLTSIVNNNSCHDIFIAKYDAKGTCQWAQKAGGTYDRFNEGWAITADALGNIFVTGKFFGDQSRPGYFGGVIITSYSGSGDVFLAKYKTDGKISWVKDAGGSWEDCGNGITLDPMGNIILTGYYYDIASFDSVQLVSSADSNVFIWKIGTPIPIQSDTSDAVFSIVMPRALSKDVDMGKVLVASAKDSVISGFIRNAGSYPFRVDSIAIIGTDVLQFGLVSGIPPFDVPAAGAYHVEFDFHPSSAGVKSAQIEIFTQADTLFQNITGVGIQPTLAIMGNVVDFGQVHVGLVKDTTITVALQNLGNVPINFISSWELGPDMTQFSLQSGSTPFTLSPGASQSVVLRFAPKYIGRTSGRIGFVYNGPSSPAILNVFGQGLGGLVSIADDSGYAGDHKNISMILGKVPVTSVQSAATNFSARIAYDRTVLYPSSGSVQHGARFDTVTVNGSIGSDSILADLPFVAMLGESMTSPMNLVDFAWLDGAGQPADFDAETSSGTFYMLGICPAGGTRLFNPDGQVSTAHINPNPASGTAHIEIETIEKGRTQLTVMNLLGQKVATIWDGELEPGQHSFEFKTNDLASGSYFFTLTTPTVRTMQRLDVAK